MGRAEQGSGGLLVGGEGGVGPGRVCGAGQAGSRAHGLGSARAGVEQRREKEKEEGGRKKEKERKEKKKRKKRK